MFNKSIKSKRRNIRRLAAIFMAGMIMLTGCGKTGSSKKTDIKNEPQTTSEPTTKPSTTIAVEPTTSEPTTQNPSAKEPVAHKEISEKTVLLGANMKKNDAELPSFDEEKKFVDSTADFSFELMKKVLAEEDDNVMISPISIINALAMTENGAAGNTLADMEKVVGRGMTRDEYNRALSAYCESLYDDKAQFSNKNSIWIRKGIGVKDAFVQKCKDYYDSEIFQAPFDESTLNDINNWGYNNTNGLIDKTIDQINETNIMFLVNALYFEGEWTAAYTEDSISEDRIFTDKDGNEDKVTMLSSQENCCFTLNNGTGFIKPYEGDKYSFVGILPADGKSPEEYISEIKGNDFIAAVTNPDYSKEVYVKIPEFSADYRTSLKNVLMDMGMETAFFNADFSEMFDLSSVDGNGADISDVFHNTHIDVDRKGTRAAATTAVEMKRCEAVEEKAVVYITLDKPFVYMIIDNETGLPVFMGTCNDIK
jgi:serpin B